MQKQDQQQLIVAAIRSFFDEAKWNYTFDDQHCFFHSGIKLKNEIEKAAISIIIGSTFYCVYYYLPLELDINSSSRARIIDLIVRINSKIGNGNFDIDSDDNSLSYKVYVNCDSQVPSREIIQDSLFTPAFMIDTYSHSILSVLNQHSTPIDAMRELEAKGDDETK